MRSITQTIILDRLQHALSSRGVDLKRSAILEIAAEAFGFLDGNAFVAAMKEGRFDPPMATAAGVVYLGDTRLAVLTDPLTSGLYAIEADKMESTSRKDSFGISPYGNLLQLPDKNVEFATYFESPDPAPTRNSKIEFVTDEDGHSTDRDVHAWRHLLSREYDLDVECDPVGNVCVRTTQMARIDGRLFFAFTFGEEYDNHAEGVATARDYAEYVKARAPFFERLGGTMSYHDDMTFGRVEVQAFLPAERANEVDDLEDWLDAIAILLGADHESVTARFNPQAWVRDNAIEVDPLGDTEFDVTVDILLMGSDAAKAMRDNSFESDELRHGALAPDWINEWSGPFYVEVADEVAEFLEQRALRKEEGKDWSCDNCGETAQDGSDVCITCGLDYGEDADADEDEGTDESDDSTCDDCEQPIDYDTGICSGCRRDWSRDEGNGIDAGALRTVMPDDAERILRQPDANDPV